MNLARPTAHAARHYPPKHRILRSVPDLVDETPDPVLIGGVATLDFPDSQVPAEVMSATLVENLEYADTIRRLERTCDDLRGRLLVLRGQTNVLTEENIGLRADLYNLMQAVEANL